MLCCSYKQMYKAKYKLMCSKTSGCKTCGSAAVALRDSVWNRMLANWNIASIGYIASYMALVS